MSSVDSLHECLGELELRRRGKGRRRSRPPRCSSPEGGAPAKEREMVRRSRSVGRLDWLAHRVRARSLARSAEISSWACLPLAAFFLQSWCYFQLLLASPSPLPHPTESLPAVSYPSLPPLKELLCCMHPLFRTILLSPADSLLQHTTC